MSSQVRSPSIRDRTLVRIAQDFPENVGVSDADGRFMPGVIPTRWLDFPIPGLPLKPGALSAIDPAELPGKWDDACRFLRQRHRRVTVTAIAVQLGISYATAKRLRQKYDLPLGD